MSVTRQVRAVLVALSLLAFGLALGGCSAQIDVRGSAPSDEDLVTVRKGIDTKAELQDRFGRPITVSVADPNIWYYVKQDLRPRPLNPPLVIDQRVVVLVFDDDDVVQSFEVAEGILGDTNLQPDPDSSSIYGPDRPAAQGLFQTIFGTVRFNE